MIYSREKHADSASTCRWSGGQLPRRRGNLHLRRCQGRQPQAHPGLQQRPRHPGNKFQQQDPCSTIAPNDTIARIWSLFLLINARKVFIRSFKGSEFGPFVIQSWFFYAYRVFSANPFLGTRNGTQAWLIMLIRQVVKNLSSRAVWATVSLSDFLSRVFYFWNCWQKTIDSGNVGNWRIWGASHQANGGLSLSGRMIQVPGVLNLLKSSLYINSIERISFSGHKLDSKLVRCMNCISDLWYLVCCSQLIFLIINGTDLLW